AGDMGDMGEFFQHCFQRFDFANSEQRLPDRGFEGKIALPVGSLAVQLEEVGPAHTKGDTLAWLPSSKVVFTGDILFIEDHPIMWAGPAQNWLNALDRIEQLQPETIVPGHGPVTDLKGVRAVRSYIKYCYDQAKLRYDAGMDLETAARDINFSDYSSWGCQERIVANLSAFYQEFSGDEPLGVTEIFTLMAKLWQDKRSA
ncbi:MAG: MBL fold metallo-hydrolase, partial [Gammaproteobacteria bacterium]